MSLKRHNAGRRPRDPQLAREEALRPSRFLGYDRDQMGVYFLGREAFALAESQFRRAVWLNPYEPEFKVHWAFALIKLNRKDEAHGLLRDVLKRNRDDKFANDLWKRYWAGEPLPEPETAPPSVTPTPPIAHDPAPEAECHDPPQ
jgi:tetratricopeptide (TPR) repeat protein